MMESLLLRERFQTWGDDISRKPWANTAFLRTFGFLKIPLLALARPSVVELGTDHCVVRLPLTWMNRNHLGLMYFGALMIAADCTGGLIAMRTIRERKARVDLLFKDVHADFLKRVEGDALFRCDDGASIRAGVDETIRTGARVNLPVHITTTVPDKLGSEIAARFVLTLTLKNRRSGNAG